MSTSKADVFEETQIHIDGQVALSTEVNERGYETSVPADMLLANFLRDRLGLTGTKIACETGHCGACTVLVDGVSVKSCAILAAQIDGAKVVTIEGVAQGGVLSKIQSALWENHAVQCGYCTPGMVLSLTDLLSRNSHPNETEIRKWIDGNICRCGVYQNVVRAVLGLTATESR